MSLPLFRNNYEENCLCILNFLSFINFTWKLDGNLNSVLCKFFIHILFLKWFYGFSLIYFDISGFKVTKIAFNTMDFSKFNWYIKDKFLGVIWFSCPGYSLHTKNITMSIMNALKVVKCALKLKKKCIDSFIRKLRYLPIKLWQFYFEVYTSTIKTSHHFSK